MEVYQQDGNESYRKRDYYNAVNFYTEGINVKCKDDELNAKLYSNRATANFYQGKWSWSQFLLLKILLEYKNKTTILFILIFPIITVLVPSPTSVERLELVFTCIVGFEATVIPGHQRKKETVAYVVSTTLVYETSISYFKENTKRQ